MKKDFSQLSKRDKSIYMNAWGMLVGNGIKQTETHAKDTISANEYLSSAKKISPVKSLKSFKRQIERKMQIEVSTWMKKRGIWHHHSPNGGRRDQVTGAIMKKMGTSAGFPDLFIPYPSHDFHGLFIELKTPTGKLTETQTEWLNFLSCKGYKAVIRTSTEDAIKLISEYLQLSVDLPPAA